MKPHVICAFPGTGKSWLAEKVGWHDSDSSSFSKLPDGSRNPDFPANYVAHIKSLNGVVLASSHLVVRDALAAAGIAFDLCYPNHEFAPQWYERRFRERGSPEDFINLLKTNWIAWLTSMMRDDRGRRRELRSSNDYLANVVPDLLIAEIANLRKRAQSFNGMVGTIREWLEHYPKNSLVCHPTKAGSGGAFTYAVREALENLDSAHSPEDQAP